MTAMAQYGLDEGLAITFRDVFEATKLISGKVLRTPMLPAPKLSQLTGASVFVKYENLQITGAFKDRGALVKLMSLTEEERRRGVIAMSAGNHAQAAGMNPQMFNSFLDGTKSAIEMAAIANACDLRPPADGLTFPPCGVDDLPHILRPRDRGGVLEDTGMVEVVSSIERDGRPVFRDLRWGVYAVLEAQTDYAAACFRQYGLKTDASGRYAAMYRPYHLIGLELNISVLSAALRGEPTGAPTGFHGDVAACAKRDLKAGEMLDGEGGYTVWGKLMPAAASVAMGALPIGLAHGVRLNRDVARGAILSEADVALDETSEAVRARRAMVARFAAPRT